MPLFEQSMTRAAFLRRASTLSALLLLDRSALALPRHVEGERDAAGPLPHPEPRPNITADQVLPAERLGKKAKVLDAYNGARTYPGVFDGIACGCGCGPANGPHRSLLVCYETAQPTGCVACQDEALLVARLAKEGSALADIRKAVDEKYG